MKREIITTADGSVSLRIPEWDETYHSKHGAVQEADHVFIKNGLSLFPDGDLSILEIGFGTGLNAFLTLLRDRNSNRSIHYVGVEAYPVLPSEIAAINYPEVCNANELSGIYKEMMSADWEVDIKLSNQFTLKKRNQFFHDIKDIEKYDLIYFDAFGFNVQPELWTEEIFSIMYEALKHNGVLVTYAARSVIRRNLKTVGFTTETLAGPPGKREMTRARKM